ncbi:hypothetical protein [Ruegeria sp. ANG-R]|uniref:hypothetical protein n=1 Tax=Ruegeria sp. ANG-R TaxID=1577903 RepID=UPI000A8633D3|nr:hypothetical protein [Ruegeria sp. ANG-R]
MESELPILLYLFSFALAALVLVPVSRPDGQHHTIQIPNRSRSKLNASQIKS